jgi:hypothetical protein
MSTKNSQSLVRLTNALLGFMGFSDSNTARDSGKEPDGFIGLDGRDYPLIVIESGWSEAPRDLIDDARLWLWCTEPPVQFVVTVEHTETETLHDRRTEEEKAQRVLSMEEMEEALSSGEHIDPEEDQKAFEKQLLDLHRQNKLMKPLLGSVQSTLCVYRRKADDDTDDDSDDDRIIHLSMPTDDGSVQQDLYCHFKHEIYPNYPEEPEKIRWDRIIGETPPPEFKPYDLRKEFCFDFEHYHNAVKRAFAREERTRAIGRACAILQRRDGKLNLPSHAERKKGSGPNMIGGQAADGPYAHPGSSSADSTDSTGSESKAAPVEKRKREKKPAVAESSKRRKIP